MILSRNRKTLRIDELVCLAGIFFPSVFICVHPWLKFEPEIDKLRHRFSDDGVVVFIGRRATA
jgi:hypothetical protein